MDLASLTFDHVVGAVCWMGLFVLASWMTFGRKWPNDPQ